MSYRPVAVVLVAIVVAGISYLLLHYEYGQVHDPGRSNASISGQDPTPLIVAETDASPEVIETRPFEDTVTTEGSGHVQLTVTWPDGFPAEGVGVELTASAVGFKRRGSTDASGVVRFTDVPAIRVHIATNRSGDLSTQVVPGQWVFVEYKIPLGVDVWGTARDPEGTPVADALVWMSRSDVPHSGQDVARTDKEGRFRVRDVSPKRMFVVHKPGYLPSHAIGIGSMVGASTDLNFTLYPGGATVSVKVVDKASRNPVEGALVRFNPMDEGLSSFMTFAVRADTMGRAVIEGAWFDTPLNVTIEADGYVSSKAIAVSSRSHEEVEVSISKGALLTGAVKDSRGIPLSGVGIRAVWSTGSSYGATLKAGRYQVRNLPENTLISLRAEKQGCGQATHQGLIISEGHAAEWNPSLLMGATIEGTVTCVEKQPMKGWLVRATRAGREVSRARTDEEGVFILTNLPADSERVELTTYCPASTAWRSKPPVIGTPGEKEVKIVVPVQRVSRVRVRFPPTHFVYASLWAPGVGTWSEIVDARGQVTFEKVPPGEYTLSAGRVLGSTDVRRITVLDEEDETDLGLLFAEHSTLVWIAEGHESASLLLRQVSSEGTSKSLKLIHQSSVGNPLILSPGSYLALCNMDGVTHHKRLTLAPAGREVIRFQHAMANLQINIESGTNMSGKWLSWAVRGSRVTDMAEGQFVWSGPESSQHIKVHVPCTSLERRRVSASVDGGEFSGQSDCELRPGALTIVDLVLQEKIDASSEEVGLEFLGASEEVTFWIYKRSRLVLSGSSKSTPEAGARASVHLVPAQYEVVVRSEGSVHVHPLLVKSGGRNVIIIDVNP